MKGREQPRFGTPRFGGALSFNEQSVGTDLFAVWLISDREHDDIVSAAGQSGCGARN